MEKHMRRKDIPGYIYALVIVGLLLLVIGMVIMVKRYTPTKEHMSLEDYFDLTEEKETAVILNGEYKQVSETESYIHGIVEDGSVYLEINFLKDLLDDGYVYDKTEEVLRYVTDQDVITASQGSSKYTIGKNSQDLGKAVVISWDGTAFVAMDFITQFTDVTYHYVADPNRVVIETAGYEKQVAVLKRDTPLRRFGGVKSKILKDAAKGEEVSILENYGKWSYVLTEDGVLACVQNKRMKKAENVVVESRLPERNYQHISLDENIILGWHQVTTASGNSTVEQTLVTTDVNVVSPTWFYLDDNKGGIANLASSSYVSYCHDHDIQVWGLVSNLENSNVDTTSVLNTTSSRDNLVNNLIAAAITYDLDGINVDMEALSIQAKDGYIEFIRELSLKCEKNDIILSIDNYVPTDSTAFYNRSVQADYADYIIIMAYDEHTSTDTEAGSVSSIGFVEKGIKDTLEEVPEKQVIVGLPFYARVWATSGDTLSSSAYGMDSLSDYLDAHGASRTWSETEGQYYAEFTENDTIYQCWIEDTTSLSRKLDLMKEYNLAGAAFWKLGFESKAIWTMIDNYK